MSHDALGPQFPWRGDRPVAAPVFSPASFKPSVHAPGQKFVDPSVHYPAGWRDPLPSEKQ